MPVFIEKAQKEDPPKRMLSCYQKHRFKNPDLSFISLYVTFSSLSILNLYLFIHLNTENITFLDKEHERRCVL